MVKGFRDFLTRGNIVDLAVAVVIGTAFAAVVKAFGDAIIKPLLNSFGAADSSGLGFSIRHGALAQATFVDVSAVLNAIVIFVLTAAIVYVVFVAPMNALAARRKAGTEPEPVAPAEDVLLLTEIRDLLRAQQAPRGGEAGLG